MKNDNKLFKVKIPEITYRVFIVAAQNQDEAGPIALNSKAQPDYQEVEEDPGYAHVEPVRTQVFYVGHIPEENCEHLLQLDDRVYALTNRPLQTGGVIPMNPTGGEYDLPVKALPVPRLDTLQPEVRQAIKNVIDRVTEDAHVQHMDIPQ